MTKIVRILSVPGGHSTKIFSVPTRKKVCHGHSGTLYNQAWLLLGLFTIELTTQGLEIEFFIAGILL
jgi:hypothetical protein